MGGRRAARGWLPDVLAIAAIAICALVVHRDGLFGGPAFYERDSQLFYYPLAQWLSQQLHAGQFPLWLPGIFTGYPILADGELGLLYLPQVALLATLPAALAIVWLRVLHVFLAGLFTYVYLRRLRLDPLPALGGSLVFAFGSFLSAQLHHENVVRSAVWLPAVLTCLDGANRATGRSGWLAWTALGALALAQSALGLHVQPVLMLLLALGGYVIYRAATRRVRRQVPVLAGAAIGLGGLGIAAAQWLPLGEWALVSSRRGGVDYEFASAFELAPPNLPTLLFPFFFRLPDATVWWTLWQQWETALYVGIPTLALVVVGLVFARRSEVVFFALLGGLALLIGMAQHAPGLNLHLLLWSVPGFSFLRAPARFTYLVVFACAVLAACGLQALGGRRLRAPKALVGAIPCVALLAAILAVFPAWRGWLLADPDRARTFVASTYLATRAQYPIDPDLVVGGLVSSLDLSAPKTAWSLLLLALTALGFVAWLGLGPRRVRLGQGALVLLLGVDLLVFAYDFHPRAPLASLVPPLPNGVAAGDRVLLHDGPDLPSLEPDQLIGDGVGSVEGYSSLPSQRHVEVEAETSAQPALFDLWSASRILEPLDPSDGTTVDGVQVRTQHPVAAGFGGALPSVFRLPATSTVVAGVRIIGTLSYAYDVPQGQTVATLTVGDQHLPIRAGVELAERAYDRPSLKGLLQHQRARVAVDFDEATSAGEAYTAHLYEADLTLAAPTRAATMALEATDPKVLVELHGIGLLGPDGRVQSLALGDRVGLERLGPGVLADPAALPRAFVVPRSQAFSPARHAGLTATQLVASPDVDLHRQVLIEGDPAVAAEPDGDQPIAAAEAIEDLGPNAVRVHASAAVPSYLVLDDFYHRGWTARVDGQPARVLIANALFRAVAIDPGRHTIDFRFEPVSHLLGAAISALLLLLALVLLLGGLYAQRRDSRRAPA